MMFKFKKIKAKSNYNKTKVKEIHHDNLWCFAVQKVRLNPDTPTQRPVRRQASARCGARCGARSVSFISVGSKVRMAFSLLSPTLSLGDSIGKGNLAITLFLVVHPLRGDLHLCYVKLWLTW